MEPAERELGKWELATVQDWAGLVPPRRTRVKGIFNPGFWGYRKTLSTPRVYGWDPPGIRVSMTMTALPVGWLGKLFALRQLGIVRYGVWRFRGRHRLQRVDALEAVWVQQLDSWQGINESPRSFLVLVGVTHELGGR